MTVSATFKIPNSAGNILISEVQTTSPDVPVLTDSNSNTWVQMSTTRGWRWQWKWPFFVRYWDHKFYSVNCLPGPNTVTATLSDGFLVAGEVESQGGTGVLKNNT